jgi:tetratricopeptide (TPR) repeat protein/tRNA A-37 threonylcarbamoyl transferase component Bud32
VSDETLPSAIQKPLAPVSVPPADAASTPSPEADDFTTSADLAAPPVDPFATYADPTGGTTGKPKPRPTPLRGDLPGYKVLQELGRGGMGVVYQARHLRLHRVVALKMILQGAHAGPDDMARFLTEAEAVARLQHPHIVQLYESGEHEGVPYFTLEYVSGGTLADKVREKPLPPEEAARVVEQLARGMAYAHAQGIVHRDLKPENVLLAEDGTPKITDFGLAKRVEGDSHLTASGAVMGTPSYMAPEQARGQTSHVGPLADVYSLGAILYRLLTGRPPFQAATVMDTLWQVMEAEPASLIQLQPKVPRDLETITLKCLQKDPARRYASAHELAEDLRRFLHGEPILARPVGRAERAWKWVKRRPAVAALTALLLLGGLVAFAAVTFEWRAEQVARETAEANEQAASEAREAAEANERTAREAQHNEHKAREQEADAKLVAEARRKEATRYFKKALEVVDKLLVRVGEDDEFLRNEPRLDQVRKKLLDMALEYYQAFLAERSDDPELRLATATVYAGVGKIYENLSNFPEAEKAYRAAVELYDKLAAEFPGRLPERQGQAQSWHDLGRVLFSRRRLKDSEQTMTHALKLRRQLFKDFPGHPTVRLDLANSLNNQGALLLDQKRWADAELPLTEGLALADALVAEHGSEGSRQAQALLCYNLARLCGATKRTEAAEDYYCRAIAVWGRLTEDFPHSRVNWDKLGNGHQALAGLYRAGNRNADAEKEYLAALAIRQRLVDEAPAVPRYRSALAGSHYGLGLVHAKVGQNEVAAQDYRAALEIQQKLVAEMPGLPAYQVDLGYTWHMLAGVQLQLKQPAEGEKSYRQAIAVRKKLVDDHPETPEYRQQHAESCYNLAFQLRTAKPPTEAEQLFLVALQESRKLTEEQPGEFSHHYQRAQAATQLATLMATDGRLDEAGELLREVRAQWPALKDNYTGLPALVQIEGSAWTKLAQGLRARGQKAEAIAAYRAAAELWEKRLGANPSAADLAGAAGGYYNLGDAYRSYLEWPESAAAFARSAALYRKALDLAPDNNLAVTWHPRALRGLAEARLMQGDHAGASQAVLEAAPTSAGKDDCFQAAKLLARCVDALRDDLRLTDDERRALSTTYADEAARLLRRAAAQGYRTGTYVQTSAYFQSVRGHGAVHALLGAQQGSAAPARPPRGATPRTAPPKAAAAPAPRGPGAVPRP